jgi:hypothetical protein
VVRTLRDKDLAYARQECGDVLLDTPPHDVEVEREVGVGDNVPQAGYFAPRHLGISAAHLGWQSLHRLADRMEVVKDTIKSHAIVEHLVAALGMGLLDDPDAALLDISQELDRVT